MHKKKERNIKYISWTQADAHLSDPEIIEPQFKVQLSGVKSQSSRKQNHSQNGVVASRVQEATAARNSQQIQVVSAILHF